MTRLFNEDLANVLKRLAPVMEKLRRRRIFITGGTGFFGKWLLDSFLDANAKLNLQADLIVLSRDPDKFLSNFPQYSKLPNLSFTKGDIRNFTFPPGQFDYVIHGATESSAKLAIEHPEEMYSVILEGTRRVLDFSVASKVKRMLFISDGAVYGTQPPNLPNIPEEFINDPNFQPDSSYGRGKLHAERLCQEYAAMCGLGCTAARCFSFVGPYLPFDSHYAVGNFINDCLENREILITGDGRPFRSYMYAVDLTVWLWTILLTGKTGRAYNVGSSHPVSIASLAKAVNRGFGGQHVIKTLKTPLTEVLPPRYVPDVKRAIAELGLTLEFGMETALRRTIQWALEQKSGQSQGHS
jgi:dTDP-glucose 4,6-dehydratase